jgi:hypothetical protein
LGETMRSLIAVVLISIPVRIPSSAAARTFVLSRSPTVYHVAE